MICAARTGRRAFSQCPTFHCDRHFQLHDRRHGAAVVELAVVLPLLAFFFLIGVDFSRVFYYSLTLQNCARAGAMYASDVCMAGESPFASPQEAALADATNLVPSPTISAEDGIDRRGRSFVEVTAAYRYRPIARIPGVPTEMNLARSVRMYRAAITPDTN